VGIASEITSEARISLPSWFEQRKVGWKREDERGGIVHSRSLKNYQVGGCKSSCVCTSLMSNYPVSLGQRSYRLIFQSPSWVLTLFGIHFIILRSCYVQPTIILRSSYVETIIALRCSFGFLYNIYGRVFISSFYIAD
jgi:hypothetical protein